MFNFVEERRQKDTQNQQKLHRQEDTGDSIRKKRNDDRRMTENSTWYDTNMQQTRRATLSGINKSKVI